MIVVIGDIMLDILLLPELKAAEQASGIVVRPGGSAANTAVWIARLGEPVIFVGCVGDDPVGRMLVEDLEREGVQAQLRLVDGVESGAVAVGVTPEGERIMRSSRGANQMLAPADIQAVPTEGVAIVHVTGYALLDPFGLKILNAACDLAERAGARLAFDPASPGVIERYGLNQSAVPLLDNHVSILLPNANEALAMTGAADPERAAGLLSEVIPHVVVKDGPRGAICCSSRRCVRVPTTPLQPVDTTGAGDAFNAGALVAIARGESLEDACQAGHYPAAVTITSLGGRPERGSSN